MKPLVYMGAVAMMLCAQLLGAVGGVDIAAAQDGRRAPLRGYAAHYGVGKMERAADIHGVPRAACMVASSYFPLRTKLDVYFRGSSRAVRCVVADISHPRDIARIRSRGIVIEIGAANLGLCGLRRVGQEPPRKCPVVVHRVGQ
jgi:hypothetical protein